MDNNHDDTRTEAQKALGIQPAEMTDEEKARDAELAKSAESEEDPFADDTDPDEPEEGKDDGKGKPETKDAPEDEGKPEKKAEEEPNQGDDKAAKEGKPDTVPIGLHLEEKRQRKAAEDALADMVAKTEGADEKAKLVKDMADDLELTEEQAKKFATHIEKLIDAKAPKQQEKEAPKPSSEEAEKAEKAYFEEEYAGFSETLAKAYPNATPQMRKEAKQRLYELARSDAYGIVPGKHDAYPLDYVLMRERKAFDALLKVAPHDRSSESSRDLSQEAEDFDFTSPDMSPEKLKRYQAQRQARRFKPGAFI